MEKESLQRFVSQFEAISSTSVLLKGKSNSERIKYYTAYIEKCREVQEQMGLLQSVGDEIERNFYNIKEQDLRMIYAKNILRLFVDIAPYFDENTEDSFDEHGKFKSHPVGVRAYNGVTQIKQVINDHCTGVRIKETDSLFFVKEYVIDCFVELMNFSSLFDAKCLSFGINLEEIQNKVGIFIQRRRRWDILSYYGFNKKEFFLNEKENSGQPFPIDNTEKSNRKPTKCESENENSSVVGSQNSDIENEKIFINYIISEKEKSKILDLLHQLIDDRKGKDVAFVILALIETGMIVNPKPRNKLYKSMRLEFGDIGSDASINDVLNPANKHKIEANTIKSIITKLREI